jgi:hypothetical protein
MLWMAGGLADRAGGRTQISQIWVRPRPGHATASGVVYACAMGGIFLACER